MKNKKYFYNLMTSASSTHLLVAVLVAILLKIKSALPTLQPHQILIPATIAQIIIFIYAALEPRTMLIVATLGNLIVVAIAIFPSTYPRPIRAHWVRPYHEP